MADWRGKGKISVMAVSSILLEGGSPGSSAWSTESIRCDKKKIALSLDSGGYDRRSAKKFEVALNDGKNEKMSIGNVSCITNCRLFWKMWSCFILRLIYHSWFICNMLSLFGSYSLRCSIGWIGKFYIILCQDLFYMVAVCFSRTRQIMSELDQGMGLELIGLSLWLWG